MQKIRSNILFLSILFLASIGLWAGLLFGVDIGSFSSFGFLNRYQKWEEAQNEYASIVASKSSLGAMKKFLDETTRERAEIENYFVQGDEGKLKLLTGLEEAGRRLGATTTVVSVIEREVVPSKKKSAARATQVGLLAETTPSAKKPTTSFFDITVTARGSFNAVYRFMHTLETLPFIITVNQSNVRLLSDGPRDGKNTTWEGSFQISVQNFTKKTP